MEDFLANFVQNAPQLMWFLGAGTSRTAGMPTATDIIWDLKRQYYCLQENQELQTHDVSNQAIKRKLQEYLDSQGFPALGSPQEYSFYFDLTFGADYGSQQRYISGQLDSQNMSLNIGHRVLAALLEMGHARVVFTTNFDEVIETAFSFVTGKPLAAFHLEGAYAALDALNAESFPIYAKIHGDFRYKSIKNLAADLIQNDQQIQKCFLAAANRYGLIVAGYSGRDANVMAMFSAALEQNNPFPQGLFWTTPRLSEVADSVDELIDSARKKGVHAEIIETGTFDIMLSKMWRQIREKPEHLNLKVRTAKAHTVSIPLPVPGTRFPILRTNALPIIECPSDCGMVDYSDPITFKELNNAVFEHRPCAILSYTDRVLFWGAIDEVHKVLKKEKIKAIERFIFEDPVASISGLSFIKSFFEHALAQSLVSEKPFLLRRKNRTYYAVVNHEKIGDLILEPLKSAVGYKGASGYLTGSVRGVKDTFWAEALSIKLEVRSGSLWLLIRPDIWVTPLARRDSATEFLRSKRIYRYNPQAYRVLDAWIKILFGTVGEGAEATVTCFADTEYSPVFKISTRTAFSRGGGANG